MQKYIVVVGGGFGGVRCALDLAKKNVDARITLISDLPHFEYKPALYRIVAGRTPLEVCIPLRKVFEKKNVEVLRDEMIDIDLNTKTLFGRKGVRYSYDFLVLALGSETSYFNISGLEERAYGFKSIAEGLSLKKHLESLQTNAPYFMVVGGGASGVELSSELAMYIRDSSRQVKIDLIEGANRILSYLPERFAERVASRLRELGIKIFVKRRFTGDMAGSQRNTLIWTAGNKPHHLYGEIAGLEYDERGAVMVDKFLQARNQPGVFVIGDGAATPYAGMAQTAVRDGKFVARAIASMLQRKALQEYTPRKPAYAVPVGRRWAAVILGSIRIYGYFGWVLKRAADLRFLMSILPPGLAWKAFRNEKTICKTCEICTAKFRG
jgi:NADH:ubiquinone reductase (H+-translocating)